MYTNVGVFRFATMKKYFIYKRLTKNKKTGIILKNNPHKRKNCMAVENKKPDRRVAKTKKAIKKAFIKLLLTKDYGKITVKDVACEADVDRKTVYNYYRGIYEIREEIENESLKSMEKIIAGFDDKDIVRQTWQIFEAITATVNENRDLFDYFFKEDSNTNVYLKVVYDVKKVVSRVLSKTTLSHLPPEKIDLISSFYAAGSMLVYREWFNSYRSTPIESVSEDLGKFVLFGLTPFVK